jgi:hypothetical protein
MNTFKHLTRFIFVLISIFGLSACSESEMPEIIKAERDDWKLYQPKIQRIDNLSLVSSESNLSQAKEKFKYLTLSDRLIFSEKDKTGKNVKLTVKTSCFTEAQASQETEYKILLNRDMYLYEFLTPEFLGQVSFNTKIKLCSFDFLAINDVGSKHFFTLKTIEIRNTTQHKDFLKLVSKAEVQNKHGYEPHFINLSELNSYSLNPIQNRSAYAQLACDQFHSPALPLDAKLKLETFFVAQSQPTFQTKRYNCRAISLNSLSQVTQISDQFYVVDFIHKPKTYGHLQITPTLKSTNKKSQTFSEINMGIPGQNIKFAEFKIYNPSDEALLFKMKNQNNFNLSIELIVKKNIGKKFQYFSQNLAAVIMLNEKPYHEDDVFEISVPSRGEKMITLGIRTLKRIHCSKGYAAYAINIRGSVHNKSMQAEYYVIDNSTEIQLGTLGLVEVLDSWKGFNFSNPVGSKKLEKPLCL